ncbi:MAG: NifB/NifX family molybdenum-iron cluster-binding protein [Alkalispirochaeta sp.]|jgi:predicted Fe-Mo cluster-binding NifX family protein
MKIAVVTDDGKTVAAHFGRARYYQVFTVEDGTITDRELRDRTKTLHHGKGHDHDHDHDHASGGHGTGAHAAERHARMVQQISDTELLLAGGMGYGAQQALSAAGITVVATDHTETEAAVTAYIDGTIEHKEERLH